MFRAVALFVGITLVLAGFSLAGAAGGPPLLVDKGKLSLGLRVTYLDEMELKDHDLKRASSDGDTVLESRSASFEGDYLYLVDIVYGVNDWLNLAASLGLAWDGEFHNNDKASGNQWRSKMDGVFVWGLGAKARLFRSASGIDIVAEAGYLRYDDRTISEWRNTSAGYAADKYWATDDHLDYWQVDFTVTGSWTIGAFTPYLGVGYTYGEADFSGNWRSHDYPAQPISYAYDAKMKLKDNVKGLLGCRLKITDACNLTAQASFISQRAFSLGLSWEF